MSFTNPTCLDRPTDPVNLLDQYDYADQDIVVMIDSREARTELKPTYDNIVSAIS